MAKKLKIMMVAGEASGDAHGARLAAALYELAPAVEFELFGAAGPRMRDAGVEATVRSDELSVVGIAEIGGALPMFLRTMRMLKQAAAEGRPDAAVLIDFPEFNLKLAKALKRQGTKVIYYISPQLWAWRKYRIEAVRKYVDLMLTILPFEKDWYAKNGIENVEFVGNPLAHEVVARRSRSEFRALHGFGEQDRVVALLPGSRTKEISRILPTMIRAAAKTAELVPNVKFVIALASGRHRAFAEEELERSPFPGSAKVTIVEDETYDALNASDAAAVTSGTATLEAGIIGTPMVVVYKTSQLNYTLIKPLVSVEHFGLINLVAGKRVAAELIQNELTAETLSAEIIRLLQLQVNAEMRRELAVAAAKLGTGGASRRAAEAIMRSL